MMILVNGTTGGIGSDLTELLIERNISWIASAVDVCDSGAVWSEMRRVRPDVVIHLAALVGTSACEEAPGQAIETNVRGTYNVVASAVSVGARVVYFSSTTIFPAGTPLPIAEDAPIRHEGLTSYGLSKLWGECMARRYMPPRDLLVIRPCFGFGGRRDRVSQLAALIRSHWTRRPVNLLLDPHLRKDYTPVRNITTPVASLIEAGVFGETFHVTQGDPRPYADLVLGLVRRGLDPRVTWHPEADYLGDHIVDASKLRATGWRPIISLDDEIDRLVAATREEFNQ